MLALTLSFVAILYMAGLRSDRAGSRTVTEAGQGNEVSTAAEEVPHDGRASAAGSPPPSASVTVPGLYRGHTAYYWARKFRHRTRQYQQARAQVRHAWHPTVLYALRLASAVTGVSYWSLYNVSRCESNHYPFAVNGQYKGIFQMHWAPFGFSPFDPVASALSAAQTVVHDGGWRQWECKP